jgi:hypothetical protein
MEATPGGQPPAHKPELATVATRGSTASALQLRPVVGSGARLLVEVLDTILMLKSSDEERRWRN